MASRKRTVGDVMVQGRQNVPVDVQWSHRDQQQKRTCGTASNPGLGQLRADEVAAFLSSLMGPQLQSIQSPEALTQYSGLDANGWQSFAELNTLMTQSFHMLSGNLLRGYHSFTTQDRQSLWLNYAKARQVPAAAAVAPAPVTYTPRHLQLVRFLLEYVLTEQEASITEYQIALPPWMVSYAARWGWGSNSTISLLLLQTYQPVNGANRASCSRTPCRRLFVPMFLE